MLKQFSSIPSGCERQTSTKKKLFPRSVGYDFCNKLQLMSGRQFPSVGALLVYRAFVCRCEGLLLSSRHPSLWGYFM